MEDSMKRQTWILATVITLALAAGAAVGGTAFAGPERSAQSHSAKPRSDDFDKAMRKLWEDHITWTRLFIVSASADLPDLGATTDRLLRNQTDIGDAIKPFYGVAAGDQLAALLRTHILTAADLLAAAKAGDSAAVEAARTAWYANADDIAAFLSTANPKNWDFAEMQAMMREHLDLTLAEAVAQLEGRFADSVALYDEVHEQILAMADMLATGIERQFPSRFRG
jgi:hypothetical protein